MVRKKALVPLLGFLGIYSIVPLFSPHLAFTSETYMAGNKALDALLGVAVGDAVGVPYEFNSRERMAAKPATDMVGYGTHRQPKGTWSDDSSLTFCLAQALVDDGYSLKSISDKFIRWKHNSYWTAHDELFDIGITTSDAIDRLERILQEKEFEKLEVQKHQGDEYDNGNGSLMRIIPLLFYIKGKPIKEQFDIIWDVSALTHRHIRAAMSCLIYLKLAEKFLADERPSKAAAYEEMRGEIGAFWDEMHFSTAEREHFKKVIQQDIRNVDIKDLKTGGYVIEVLESSIWFFLKRGSYKDIILDIINLGHDTDTAAAIAGGLAGIYYGESGMPPRWVADTARVQDIRKLGEQLNEKYSAK